VIGPRFRLLIISALVFIVMITPFLIVLRVLGAGSRRRVTPERMDLADRVRSLESAVRAEQAVHLVRGDTGMDAAARTFVHALGPLP
jgi:hypothetical protein